MALRIHQHVERLMRSRTEIFEEATRKRGPPEPVDGMDSAKRQRLGAETSTTSSRLFIPPLTPGPHTVGELFTLSTDEGLKKFDVASLDEDLVIRIAATILSTVDANTLNQAINVWADSIFLEIVSNNIAGCPRPLHVSRHRSDAAFSVGSEYRSSWCGRRR